MFQTSIFQLQPGCLGITVTSPSRSDWIPLLAGLTGVFTFNTFLIAQTETGHDGIMTDAPVKQHCIQEEAGLKTVLPA